MWIRGRKDSMNPIFDELIKAASAMIALLAVGTIGVAVGWIKKKSNNKTIEKYMPILEGFVDDAVKAANQAAVKTIRKKMEDGEISKEEKDSMLKDIKDEVGSNIRAIAPNYILKFFEEAGVDVTKLIETLIEKHVMDLK